MAVFSFIGSPFSGPNGPDLQRDIAQQAKQLDSEIAVTQNQIADKMRRQTNTINYSANLPLAQGIKFDI